MYVLLFKFLFQAIVTDCNNTTVPEEMAHTNQMIDNNPIDKSETIETYRHLAQQLEKVLNIPWQDRLQRHKSIWPTVLRFIILYIYLFEMEICLFYVSTLIELN